MYYDPKEDLERERGTERGGQLARVRRDVAGLLMLALGALATVVAVAGWHPLIGVGLAGVYLMVGGWFVASDSSE
ncbi:hypothetical protein [Nonomuraea candida]|uniref:hypothetical protein n=1 Tax=Nonomuraea candida TaxID=359159 RepID=UPI0005BE1F43|nr:hypothetical protein [Nonomuraea candida]